MTFAATAGASAAAAAFGRVDINTDGTVLPQTANGFASLDGIHFRLTV